MKDFYQLNLKRHLRNPRVITRRNKVLSEINNISNKQTILDLGCGVGVYSYYLSKLTPHVFSVDKSKENLEAAKKIFNLKNTVLANATNLPFKNETFDLVIATELIEHIKDSKKLLNEINRVIKKEGILILTTSPIKSDFLYPILRKIKKTKFLNKYMGVDPEKGHINEQHPETLKKNLLDNGFRLVKEHYWNSFHLYSLKSICRYKITQSFLNWFDKKFGRPTICTDSLFIAKVEGPATGDQNSQR